MKSKRKVFVGIVIFLLIVSGSIYLLRDQIERQFFKPTSSSVENGKNSMNLQTDPVVAAQDLTVPWGVAFLPDGDMFVTERSGSLLRIGNNKQEFPIEGVTHIGEGGLLGVALHPNFTQNQHIYLYMTTRTGGNLTNRIERYKYENDSLSARTIILENIPGAANHDGGRLAFGPDGLLYATTGDAGVESLAQNKNSLAGKILRLTDEGRIPADNPFNNAVYSYGHRNPQGLAWDSKGQLWSSEHGRSGLQSGYDELNLIKKGANYGWPEIQGDESSPGMEKPAAHSGPNETWAPASLAFYENSLFFGGLRGESLYEAEVLEGNGIKLTAHFREDFGRLRTVVLGTDNMLYMTTSNTDGRGAANSGDDKIIKVDPRVLTD